MTRSISHAGRESGASPHAQPPPPSSIPGGTPPPVLDVDSVADPTSPLVGGVVGSPLVVSSSESVVGGGPEELLAFLDGIAEDRPRQA